MSVFGADRGQTLTFKAAAALNPNLFVKLTSTAGQVDVPGNHGDTIGVVTEKVTAAGRAVPVQVSGVAKLIAAGAIAVGAQVDSDATGKAQSYTPAFGSASLKYTAGRALTSAANSGDFVYVWLERQIVTNS